jgi:UDP-N-acetylglucosamine--N-acetylmuramyl-(pentapeptide) pyrophosphoryl-undecaprenol N-acetylglucosamine transferase
VNDLVAASWKDLLSHMQIVHICGAHDVLSLTRAAESLSRPLQRKLWLAAYIGAELPALLARATVVISRAGGTVFELAAAASPSILLPLSTSAGNHQAKNARAFERQQAAVVFDERIVTSKILTEEVLHLVKDSAARSALQQNIARFAAPKAASMIADELWNLCS